MAMRRINSWPVRLSDSLLLVRMLCQAGAEIASQYAGSPRLSQRPQQPRVKAVVPRGCQQR